MKALLCNYMVIGFRGISFYTIETRTAITHPLAESNSTYVISNVLCLIFARLTFSHIVNIV